MNLSKEERQRIREVTKADTSKVSTRKEKRIENGEIERATGPEKASVASKINGHLKYFP